MKLIYIIAVIIIIIYIYFKLKGENDYTCFKLLGKRTQEEVDNIYYILFMIDKIFTQYKITYFMNGRTLLGAVRHKGLIPWDHNTNTNIGVFENDINRIVALQEEFKKYEISIHKKEVGYILYYKEEEISLDPFKKKGDKYINLAQYSINRSIDKHYYNRSELVPIRRYYFGPISLLGPSNSISYLKRLYGNKIFRYCYDDNSNKKVRKLKMAKDDYSPILPSNF